MTAAIADGEDKAVEARRLSAEGLSLRQVATRLGVSHTTVRFWLAGASQSLRPRHLQAVPPRSPATLHVPPDRAAMAYTADRGWHLVQAPQAWALDLLAELD